MAEGSENRLTLIGLLIGCFLISLDPNLVGIVTPELVQDFQATPLYGWVAGSYLIALTISVPIVGRMVEVYSGRRVYLGSLIIFLLGTALSGLAPHIYSFIVFRVIQGAGAGGIFATNFAVAAIIFPPREQGVVLSYFNVVSGLAMVGGAVVGGVLSDHATWRAVFLANLLPGLLAFAILYAKLPQLRPERPARMDIIGAFALVCWCIPLMLLSSHGGGEDSWSVPFTVALGLVIVAGMIGFTLFESRQAEPLLNPRLMKASVFRWGSLAAWCVGAMTTSAMVYVPLFAVEAQDLSATQSSLVLICQTVFAILGSLLGGRLLLKLGAYKPMMLACTVGCTLAFYWTSKNLDIHLPFWQLMGLMAVFGLLFGIMMPLYPLAVQNSVEKARAGSATTAVQFSQMLGSSMGAALSGVILALSLNAHFPALVSAHVESELIEGTATGYTEKEHLQDQLKQNIEQLRLGLREAKEGNAEAEKTLRNNPFLPEDLQQLVNGDLPHTQEKIQAELQELTNRLGGLIEDVVDGTIVRALQAVYLALAAVALFSVFLSLLIPGLPLRSQVEAPALQDE